MPDNYHLAPCPECKGYNHECEACDGFGELWVCNECGGKGVTRTGRWVIQEMAGIKCYTQELIYAPCPQCNDQPIIKVDW